MSAVRREVVGSAPQPSRCREPPAEESRQGVQSENARRIHCSMSTPQFHAAVDVHAEPGGHVKNGFEKATAAAYAIEVLKLLMNVGRADSHPSKSPTHEARARFERQRAHRQLRIPRWQTPPSWRERCLDGGPVSCRTRLPSAAPDNPSSSKSLLEAARGAQALRLERPWRARSANLPPMIPEILECGALAQNSARDKANRAVRSTRASTARSGVVGSQPAMGRSTDRGQREQSPRRTMRAVHRAQHDCNEAQPQGRIPPKWIAAAAHGDGLKSARGRHQEKDLRPNIQQPAAPRIWRSTDPGSVDPEPSNGAGSPT